MAETTFYAAVRRDGFKEYTDYVTAGLHFDDAGAEAQETNKNFPEWAVVHPVLRIAKFRAVEIKEE
jgi:hypothetical protein